MNFKTLIVYLILISLTTARANWQNKIGNAIHGATIAGYISLPFAAYGHMKNVCDHVAEENKQFLLEWQKEPVTAQDYLAKYPTPFIEKFKKLIKGEKEYYPNYLPQQATRNYIIERAKALNLDTKHMLVTVLTSEVACAEIHPSTIDGIQYIKMEIGSKIENDLLAYLKKKTNTNAPFIIEHELMHVKDRHFDPIRQQWLSCLPGIFAALLGSIGHKNFIINTQDSLKKSLIKSSKIGALAFSIPMLHFLTVKASSRHCEKRADILAIKSVDSVPLAQAGCDSLVEDSKKMARLNLSYTGIKNPTEEDINHYLFKEAVFNFLDTHPSTYVREAYMRKATQELEKGIL